MDTAFSKHSELRDAYSEELRCIRQILQHSEQFLADEAEFDVNSVKKLLEERQPWIDILKNIEETLRSAGSSQDDLAHLKSEIAELGNSLIALDAKIMDILLGRKQAIVKELMKNTDNINRRRKEEAPRIINIKQE